MSEGCSNVGPSILPDCADPAFRDAHPDLCKAFTELIIKPEYALTEPGETVTFKAFLRANGQEMEITKGLLWGSTNMSAAEIAQDGVATGVMEGSTSISVAWQTLNGYAQLDVVASCASTHQHFAILIDNSKSMGQNFSSAYSTKLAFSKAIARDFCNTVNFSKDDISAWKFGDAPTRMIDWNTDAAETRQAIADITSSNQKTDLATALSQVISNFPSSGVRVLILFTEGEYTGDNPLSIARDFKESGGFLVVVATRAWGDAFELLAQMASGGFLLSAYEDTEDTVLDNLSGLKNFICSGSCNPEPGTAPHAQLNYTGFINWDVTQGRVDLVGLRIWDVLQDGDDHGLYLDLRGTADCDGCDLDDGQITSKDDFLFTSGEQYRITVGLAGNWRRVVGDFKVRIRCGDELDEEVTISTWNYPMTPQVFNWTPSITHSGKIIIEQTERPAGTRQNIGTLLDDITLENITLASVLLQDDFNSENPTTIENEGSYYGGCIEMDAQTADPTPPQFMTE